MRWRFFESLGITVNMATPSPQSIDRSLHYCWLSLPEIESCNCKHFVATKWTLRKQTLSAKIVQSAATALLCSCITGKQFCRDKNQHFSHKTILGFEAAKSRSNLQAQGRLVTSKLHIWTFAAANVCRCKTGRQFCCCKVDFVAAELPSSVAAPTVKVGSGVRTARLPVQIPTVMDWMSSVLEEMKNGVSAN